MPGHASLMIGASTAKAHTRAALLATAQRAKRVETTTRKPMLLFLLSGLFLLRYAQRTFLDSLLKEPPRWSEGISPAVGNSLPTDA